MSIVFLDTIRHVYRSGRIPKVASQIGSVLNIKPILVVSGKVHFAGVVRSRKHGIERMLQMMREKVGQNPVHVAVMHAYALDEAEKLKERIASEFNCAELWLAEFSPVMGYACGTGTVGIAFYPEEEGDDIVNPGKQLIMELASDFKYYRGHSYRLSAGFRPLCLHRRPA